MSAPQPQDQDATLGGQMPPPIYSASLGGLEGIRQRLKQDDHEQRIVALTQAIVYQEPGLDLLIAALQDPLLDIRTTAYHLLRSVTSDKVKAAIANGILLNPGDRVYAVYKAAISFDDERFHLQTGFEDYINEINWPDLRYKDYEDFSMSDESGSSGEIDSYIPKRIGYYISQAEAEAVAKQMHDQFVSEWKYGDWFKLRSGFVFHEWCKINQIAAIDQYDYAYELTADLRAKGNSKLLAKLWRDSIGDFAFVRKETVSKRQYLTF